METKTKELIEKLFNDGPTDNIKLFESTIIKDIEWHLIVNNYHHDVVIQLYYGFNFLKGRLDKLRDNPPHHWIENVASCNKAKKFLEPEINKLTEKVRQNDFNTFLGNDTTEISKQAFHFIKTFIESNDVRKAVEEEALNEGIKIQNLHEYVNFWAVDKEGAISKNLDPETDFPMFFQQRFKSYLQKEPTATEDTFHKYELSTVRLQLKGEIKTDGVKLSKARYNASAYEKWLEKKIDNTKNNQNEDTKNLSEVSDEDYKLYFGSELRLANFLQIERCVIDKTNYLNASATEWKHRCAINLLGFVKAIIEYSRNNCNKIFKSPKDLSELKIKRFFEKRYNQDISEQWKPSRNIDYTADKNTFTKIIVAAFNTEN